MESSSPTGPEPQRPSSEPAPSSAPEPEPYKVGPGRPPKEYQWKPGQSGNPGGKGKRESLTAMLRRVLEKDHNGKSIGELLVERLVKEALGGKLPHIKEVLDRVEGRVKEKIEVEAGGTGCVVFQVPPPRVLGESEGAPALAPLREGVAPAAQPLVVRGECWKEV